MNSILLKLLRSELCGQDAEELLTADERAALRDPKTPETLYRLAAPHDLQHMIGNALYQLKVPDSTPVMLQYRQSMIQAVCRYEALAYETNRLYAFLDELEVPYLPLKGAVIRLYYPAPEMRTSCDVDILVQKERLDEVCHALTDKLKYIMVKSGGHDVQFRSPGGEHLELHFTLTEVGDHSKAGAILEKVWELATPVENHPCQREMPSELAYYYHIFHMMKHFLYGGCGIRTIMDLWIFRHRIDGFSAELAEKLIVEGGLEDFEREMVHLSDWWFSGIYPEHTDEKLLHQVEAYIFAGGIYGTAENRVKIGRVENSKLAYIHSRLILPYDHIKYDYPILQKYPVLTPFCQVSRWFHLFSKDTAKRIGKELKNNRELTREEQREVRDMLKKLKLR